MLLVLVSDLVIISDLFAYLYKYLDNKLYHLISLHVYTCKTKPSILDKKKICLLYEILFFLN